MRKKIRLFKDENGKIVWTSWLDITIISALILSFFLLPINPKRSVFFNPGSIMYDADYMEIYKGSELLYSTENVLDTVYTYDGLPFVVYTLRIGINRLMVKSLYKMVFYADGKKTGTIHIMTSNSSLARKIIEKDENNHYWCELNGDYVYCRMTTSYFTFPQSYYDKLEDILFNNEKT